MKSPVLYFGSKQRIAPWIVDLLPAHDHYVEPYCGGLSVLLAKQPSPMETVNDLDGELMVFWRVLRDRPADLLRACLLTPHSRAELAAAHQPTEAGDELELARRIWCRLAQGRAGTLRNTGWRYYIDPAGSATSMPGYMSGYVAAALADCKATVVLSGYGSALYDDLYAGWHRAERPTMTGNANGEKSRVEVLWCNRPLAAVEEPRDLFSDIPA